MSGDTQLFFSHPFLIGRRGFLSQILTPGRGETTCVFLHRYTSISLLLTMRVHDEIFNQPPGQAHAAGAPAPLSVKSRLIPLHDKPVSHPVSYPVSHPVSHPVSYPGGSPAGQAHPGRWAPAPVDSVNPSNGCEQGVPGAGVFLFHPPHLSLYHMTLPSLTGKQ